MAVTKTMTYVAICMIEGNNYFLEALYSPCNGTILLDFIKAATTYVATYIAMLCVRSIVLV